MATYDLISTIGPFSDPNDWLNESTQMSGVPGPSDTAVTNGASVTGSGNVGTLDGGLTMNALTLTAQTLMDAGIQVANGSSLTVSGGFSLVSSDNIDVSNGVLTTNGAVTGDVSALTGGIEVDTSGIWIANATVSFSRINSSGNLTAGALSDVSSLQIGGGTATAGSVSAQKYVVVQGAQVTLGAVSILGTPPASLPAFEISNQATVETGAITGNASLAPAGSSNLEVLGSGTTLMVKGDVEMLSGLVAGTSSNTSITGNLEENDLQIGGDDTSNLPTKVGVVGNVDIGTGSSPVSTISQVTEGGDLSLGGVLTIGADAGWNNTLEVNDNSAETGNFGSTSLFPGIVLAKSIDIGAAGIGTLDIESGGGVNASGTVTVGDGSQLEDAVIVNGASSELSAAAMTFPDATATVENDGELFTGDGPIGVSELGDIIVAGGTINGEASIEAFSTIEGFGTLEGQGQNNGAVAANGGTLMLANDWTGTGDFVIQGQSTLYVQAALNSGAFTIDFNLGGAPGTLIIPDANFFPAINNMVPGDLIDVRGSDITGFNYTPVNADSGLLTITDSGVAKTYFEFDGSFTTGQFHHSPSPDGTYISVVPACYAAGTRILTERGEVAVENLRVGDRLVTHFRTRGAPIVWLGHRRVDCDRHPRPRDVWPVRIRAAAFGPGRPHRDLLLSPDHAVFLSGLLIPIRLLVNGQTIVSEQVGGITYWHVELSGHDVILVEGMEAESYLDTGNRSAFANGDAIGGPMVVAG